LKREPVRVRIVVGGVEVLAEISFNENPRTAEAVLEALPIESRAARWGDEVYFEVPVELPAENARVRVQKGEVAYWPEEPSLCIFFGKTPVSPSEDDIRAYSPVNVIGRLVSDPSVLRTVKDGDRVRVERA